MHHQLLKLYEENGISVGRLLTHPQWALAFCYVYNTRLGVQVPPEDILSVLLRASKNNKSAMLRLPKVQKGVYPKFSVVPELGTVE